MSVHAHFATTFLILLVAAANFGCEQKPAGTGATAPVQATNEAVQKQPGSAASANRFEKLPGKWARMDGDYVLEIKSVDNGGQMEAAYYNPNPIKISRALGITEGKDTKVFVELRDEGYPGCTYSLSYSQESDQLFGSYFQAAMQQTYEVVFSRIK